MAEPQNIARLRPFQPFSPTKWHGLAPPPYDWIVDGCFLRGTVAMLSGDGGLGKSLIMQQLLTAAAIGKPWLGLDTQRSRVLGFFCEDDEDELHRRQEAICEHYDCSPGDLSDAEYISRVGMENVLAEFDRRTEQMKSTPVFDQLRNAVRAFGAQILVLDTVADVFAGDEIRRNQVRRFVSMLRGLAVEMQGVVILSAHPSLTGINSGSGLSGSTAWNNSVRSRLYLTRVKQDEEEEDTNARYLKTMKNNQGPYGGRIKLHWRGGVFVREDAPGQPINLIDRMEVDRMVENGLRLLVSRDSRVAADPAAANGLANRVRDLPECKHLTWAIAVAAQDRLLAAKRIVKVEMGPPSKRRVYLRTVDQRYPGETSGETA